MPFLRTTLLASLVAGAVLGWGRGSVRADDPAATPKATAPDAGAAAAPAGAPTGDKSAPGQPRENPPILVAAQYTFKDGTHCIKVQGQTTDLPEGARLTVALFLRKIRSQMASIVEIHGSSFAADIYATQRLLPGYYEVRAMFEPWAQFGDIRAQVEGKKIQEGRFFLKVGTDQEITDSRKDLIKFYEDYTDKLKENYVRIRTAYQQVIAKKKEWAGQVGMELFRKAAQEPFQLMEKDFQTYNAYYGDAVISPFPRISNSIKTGYELLGNVLNDMDLSLETQLENVGAAPGSKQIKYEDVLAQCDEEMGAHLDDIRSQIKLEKNPVLRDLLMNQYGQLLWLYNTSHAIYDARPEITAWQEARTPWDGTLGDLEKALAEYKGTSLARENQEATKQLLSIPELLKSLWKIYDAVLVDAKPVPEAELQRVDELLQNTLKKTARKFDFTDDLEEALIAINTTRSGKSSESQSALEKRQLEDAMTLVKSKKDEDRVRAIRILAAFKERTEGSLKEGMDAWEGPSKNAAAIALGLCGNASAQDRILPLLQSEAYEGMRALVADALGTLAKPQSLDPLLKALKKDASPAVRAAAAGALGQVKDTKALPALLTALEDADVNVRTRAQNSMQVLLTDEMPIFMPDADDATRAGQVSAIKEWWGDRPKK